ncbi:MAG: recE [Dermatophilaceae bacterium]|nr:recE [Dermatophilaceae bacterium]
MMPETWNDVHQGLDEAEYHASPGLSVSGAKTILDCPARFDWQRRNPRQKRVFDFGHAAHGKVLGVGLEVVAVPTDLLASNGAASTKAAKEWIEQARAEGKVPLKVEELAVVDAMATALERSDAAPLFRDGQAEQSLFWLDEATNLPLRARLDWVTTWHDVPLVVDYKTTTNANPDQFRWEAGKFGYHMQDSWYREGMDTLTGTPHGFVFVAQEKEPPYLVSVVELDDDARDIGTQRNGVARRLYEWCLAEDRWPGYPGIHRISIPNARPAKETVHV